MKKLRYMYLFIMVAMFHVIQAADDQQSAASNFILPINQNDEEKQSNTQLINTLDTDVLVEEKHDTKILEISTDGTKDHDEANRKRLCKVLNLNDDKGIAFIDIERAYHIQAATGPFTQIDLIS